MVRYILLVGQKAHNGNFWLICLGNLHGAGLARVLALQIFWVAILLAAGDGMGRWSSPRLTIQGG
jgi:hypothetical protein